MTADKGGVIEVAGIESVQCLPNEGAHLVFSIVVEHFDDRASHLLELSLQKVRVEVGDKLRHAGNVHIDVAASHEAESLSEADLSVLERNQCEFFGNFVFLVDDLHGVVVPILHGDMEFVNSLLQEICQQSLQELHLPHSRFDIVGDPALQFYPQDQFLHLHKLSMIGRIVAIQHPADEMRNQVLTPGHIVLELAEQVDIEIPFFLSSCELGVLVDPALVVAQSQDLFFSEGLEFLEEVDAPGGVADHLVSGGLERQRRSVDETVEVVRCSHVHFARNY